MFKTDLHSQPVEVRADDWTDDEDRQLEDPEDEAVLGRNAAFFLSFLRVKWSLNSFNLKLTFKS